MVWRTDGRLVGRHVTDDGSTQLTQATTDDRMLPGGRTDGRTDVRTNGRTDGRTATRVLVEANLPGFPLEIRPKVNDCKQGRSVENV